MLLDGSASAGYCGVCERSGMDWRVAGVCGAICAAWLASGWAPAREAPRAGFLHHVIDADGPADPWLKAIGDLNGDGKPDLIAGGAANGGLVWYRNPGWGKQTIAEGSFSTDGEAVDMDGDGDMDVAAITTRPASLVWFENPGWERHAIADSKLHDVEVCDLNQDGRPDLVARDQGSFGARGDEIHFFLQAPGGKWPHTSMRISSGEGLHLADIDNDGDRDLVIEKVWYENTGDPFVRSWTPHSYGAGWEHPFAFVATGRINGDGRLDIVLSPAEKAGEWGRISWFEAPAKPRSGAWREHVVDAKAEAVHHFVGAADFDGDGATDIAAAQMRQGADPDEVKIYLNRGGGKSWTKAVIATGGSHSMKIADLDGDGDMDLYGANWRGTSVIEWWENVGTQPSRR